MTSYTSGLRSTQVHAHTQNLQNALGNKRLLDGLVSKLTTTKNNSFVLTFLIDKLTHLQDVVWLASCFSAYSLAVIAIAFDVFALAIFFASSLSCCNSLTLFIADLRCTHCSYANWPNVLSNVSNVSDIILIKTTLHIVWTIIMTPQYFAIHA